MNIIRISVGAAAHSSHREEEEDDRIIDLTQSSPSAVSLSPPPSSSPPPPPRHLEDVTTGDEDNLREHDEEEGRGDVLVKLERIRDQLIAGVDLEVRYGGQCCGSGIRDPVPF